MTNGLKTILFISAFNLNAWVTHGFDLTVGASKFDGINKYTKKVDGFFKDFGEFSLKQNDISQNMGVGYNLLFECKNFFARFSARYTNTSHLDLLEIDDGSYFIKQEFLA